MILLKDKKAIFVKQVCLKTCLNNNEIRNYKRTFFNAFFGKNKEKDAIVEREKYEFITKNIIKKELKLTKELLATTQAKAIMDARRKTLLKPLPKLLPIQYKVKVPAEATRKKKLKKITHRRYKREGGWAYYLNYYFGLGEGYIGFYIKKYTGITVPQFPKFWRWGAKHDLEVFSEQQLKKRAKDHFNNSKVLQESTNIIPFNFIDRQRNNKRWGRFDRPYSLSKRIPKKSKFKSRGKKKCDYKTLVVVRNKHRRANTVMKKLKKRRVKIHREIGRLSFLLYYLTFGFIIMLLFSKAQTEYEKNIELFNKKTKAKKNLAELTRKKEEFNYKKALIIAKQERDKILSKNANKNSNTKSKN